MELWSKGLGRRVLSMALGERTNTTRTPTSVAVEGVMHAPTYWEYAVVLDGQDVVEFLAVLSHPDAVRFLAGQGRATSFLRTATGNAALFLVNTAKAALSRRPAVAPAAAPKEWSGMGYVPDDDEGGSDDGGT